MAGYTDAWLGGADFIEQDIHMTSDGHLIINHDQCLKNSTNAVLFDDLWSDRQRTFTLQPEDVTCTDDYAIPDFTLAELKMLKRKQRYDFRSKATDGVFDMLTLDETI